MQTHAVFSSEHLVTARIPTGHFYDDEMHILSETQQHGWTTHHHPIATPPNTTNSHFIHDRFLDFLHRTGKPSRLSSVAPAHSSTLSAAKRNHTTVHTEQLSAISSPLSFHL
jgi:hypothetical protein